MLSKFPSDLLDDRKPFVHFRVSLIILSLLSIFYCSIYMGVWVPNYQFQATWQPDGIMKVVHPYPNTEAEELLRPGDRIIAIDGQQIRRQPFSPLFAPDSSAYTYTILRENQYLDVTVPTGAMTLAVLQKRMTSPLVAFGAWLVASLIILYATPLNRDGWAVGLTTMGLSITLASAEAALYDVPFTRLASEPFIPFFAVAFAQLGFLPRETHQHSVERWLFRILYVGAVMIGLLSLFEVLYLAPRGTSIELLSGVSLDEVILIALGMGLMLNPVILMARVLKMPSGYLRQQIQILLIATMLSILPLVILTILPKSVLDIALVPWELSLLWLLLQPCAYAYIILRRRYLNLDIVATRTIMALILTLFMVAVFIFALFMVNSLYGLSTADPFASSLSLTVALVGTFAVNRPFQITARRIVYGKNITPEDYLEQLSESLSASPQFETLRSVFFGLLDIMQVRQGAFFVINGQQRLDLLALAQVDVVLHVDLTLVDSLPKSPILRSSSRSKVDNLSQLFAAHPWIEVIVPLMTRGNPVGVILLGTPVPDAYFNAEEIRFLKQAIDAMSVAAEASRLFEASLKMSCDLLQVRDEERTQLAAEIHNDPLQRISLVASNLDRLAHQDPALMLTDIPGVVRDQSQELQLVAEQLRTICAGLRSPVMAQGIQWAIKEVIHEFRHKTSYNLHLRVDVPITCQIPQLINRATYYVLLEALNNIQKHSKITTDVWVYLALLEMRTLSLTIEDNGQGFGSMRLSLADLVRSHHFGVVGMYEWVSLAGGTLEIQPRPAGGTVVQAMFSIEHDMHLESI